MPRLGVEVSRPAWRTRPDCAEPGCEIEQAYGRDYCRDHDPDLCTAELAARGQRSGRCRNRKARGLEVCRWHRSA